MALMLILAMNFMAELHNRIYLLSIRKQHYNFYWNMMKIPMFMVNLITRIYYRTHQTKIVQQ